MPVDTYTAISGQDHDGDGTRWYVLRIFDPEYYSSTTRPSIVADCGVGTGAETRANQIAAALTVTPM